MASTWPPGLVPLAPSLLGPHSSFYYAPLRERETERETNRSILRERERECEYPKSGVSSHLPNGEVKTLNIIVDCGVVLC